MIIGGQGGWEVNQLSLSFHRGFASEGRGSRPSPSHRQRAATVQMNSLQQQPLSSPAATRSASTRNQPANSFRCELRGGGWGRGVLRAWCYDWELSNWQVCLNPVSDTHIAPPTPLLGSDNNRVGFQQHENTFQNDRFIQRRRGYSTYIGCSISLIPSLCGRCTICLVQSTCQVYVWLFLVEYVSTVKARKQLGDTWNNLTVIYDNKKLLRVQKTVFRGLT